MAWLLGLAGVCDLDPKDARGPRKDSLQKLFFGRILRAVQNVSMSEDAKGAG
jgi:hypothetical protein